ncbi:hypothetical protein [Variovorax soli]|uniref:hypothetical protein n=1 Tax=Variovorax soli TaxID=376815 RepID=UPI001FE08EB7|nr:hypothetical protein [Variovorax soli]
MEGFLAELWVGTDRLVLAVPHSFCVGHVGESRTANSGRATHALASSSLVRVISVIPLDHERQCQLPERCSCDQPSGDLLAFADGQVMSCSLALPRRNATFMRKKSMNRTGNLAQGIADLGERLPFLPPGPQVLSLLRGQPALAPLHTDPLNNMFIIMLP